jgi:hypothetical protein
MLNHPIKFLIILISCSVLFSCHKAPVLDKSLALKILSQSQDKSGYAISIASNNPHAHGDNARGWTCEDKQNLVEAEVAKCKKSGRSGVYLSFTDKGKEFLLGQPWGDSNIRNARVIAVTKHIQSITSVDLLNKTKASVAYVWAYNQHTPFSNDQLKKLIPLHAPHSEVVDFILTDDKWAIAN